MADQASTGNQPLAPLSDSKLDLFLQTISDGTLTLSAVQRALLHPSGQLNVLKTLIRLFTSKVPWGGIAYHYSNIPINSLVAEDVFDKLIVRGLGGHCLEMVPLFASVLRGLGYNFYITGARVSSVLAGEGSDSLGFHGWSHIVLILTASGLKYVVDPQFVEIAEPVLLDPAGPEIIFSGVPTTIIRLRYCALADVIPHKASNSGLMTWVFEFKHSPTDLKWSPAYIFSPETEWYLEDLPIMNVWLAKAADSYLVSKFVMKRILLAGADDPIESKSMKKATGIAENGLLVTPEISGSAEIASDVFVVYRHGKKVIEKRIETEQERVEILNKWFDVTLTEDETRAILNRPTALRH